jgi:uncharacterized membrane protein YfcA
VHVDHALLLFAAAFAAGSLNAVAGGGTFVSFPALIFAGISPIQANATNTAALFPGTMASAGAYRGALKGYRGKLIPLIISAMLGGAIGAWILLHTPQRLFMDLVPWFLLSATLLFAFGKPINAYFRQHAAFAHRGASSALGGLVLQLIIGTYVGYFGAGAGILMLAMLGLLGETDIHAMNGMKSLIVTLANGVATTTFILSGAVLWPQAMVMIVGATIGGYVMAWYAQKIDPRFTRGVVIASGLAMAAYFLVR